jgi:hypothetical protein
MNTETTIEHDPPPTEEDDDGDDNFYIAASIGLHGVTRHCAINAPATIATAELASALMSAARGVAGAFSPGLLAIVNASLVDTAQDAVTWVSVADTAATGNAHLTSAAIEVMDMSHRHHYGRPLQAVRVGVEGEIVPLSMIRAVLKAAGR